MTITISDLNQGNALAKVRGGAGLGLQRPH